MKEQIKEAALRLFLKFGPKRITVDDVAGQLQISRKIFYEYYRNKNELIQEIFEEVIEDAKQKLLSIDQDNDIIRLLLWQCYFYNYLMKYSVSCVYEINKYYPDLVNVYWLFRNNMVFKRLIKFSKSAQAHGIFRGDINVRVFAEMQLYSLEELLFGRFIEINELTVKEQDAYASHIIINNVRGVVSNTYLENFEMSVNKLRRYECSKG